MAFGFTGNARNDGDSAAASVTHGLTINSGDLVVAYVNTNGTGTTTADSDSGAGWTEELNEIPSGETARQVIYSRIANGSEPSAYAWTLGSSTLWHVIIKVFTSATDAIEDSAAASHIQGSNSNDVLAGAADGAVISDDALSVIFGGKDTSSTTEAYTVADNSYTGVVGDRPGRISAGAHRIYTTGLTFSGDIRIETADGNDGKSDKVYSIHMSFVESVGGPTFTQDLAGAITPAGGMVRLTDKLVAGANTPIGGLSRLTSISPSGIVTPTGAIVRETLKTVVGGLVPTGALVAVTLFFKIIAGTVTPTGAILKETQKNAAGSLTPSGTMVRDTLINPDGIVTPTGIVIKETAKAFTGSVTPTGAMTPLALFSQVIVGSVASAGAFIKSTLKNMTGGVAPVGTQTKLTAKRFTGSITPQGVLSLTFGKVLSGVVTISGALVTLFIDGGGGGSTGFTDPRGQWPGLPLSAGEWTAFITAAGGTVTGDLASDARIALATAVGGITDAQALRMSMNDLWKRYQLAGFPLV